MRRTALILVVTSLPERGYVPRALAAGGRRSSSTQDNAGTLTIGAG